MPRWTHIKSIFGESISVQEGSIHTRTAYEQWNGWVAGKARTRRPGLRDQLRTSIENLEWMVDHIDRIIEDGITHTLYGGKPRKVIEDYDEDDFYESLEDLRDSLNDTLNEAAKRRPLQRRIELAQQMVDHPKTEPEQRAAAQNRIKAMKKKLEEGER